MSNMSDTIHYKGEIWEMIEVWAEGDNQIKCHLRHPTRATQEGPVETMILVKTDEIEILNDDTPSPQAGQ